ncbi:MAG: hypothetical protein N3E49_07280 [Bacteroidia bacterium]|nr:hypothetical protein [Bacteroidia bacterium]
MAVEAAEDKEEKIHQEARYILQEFEYKNQDLIDLLAQRWVETRSDWIESLLLKHKYKPTASPKVRVLVLLKTSQRHELHIADEYIIREVLYACADRDKDVAREAEKLIAEQKESWGPIILRWFSAEDFPEAGKAIVKASYALPNPDDTALLYFLCGDINAYEERDPEYAYLQSTYGKASPELKARLRAKLQAIGRPDIASVVLYQKDAARLEQLSYEEWETLIHALKAAKNLSELWQLVFKAPPHWAAEIVLFLHEEFFVPPSEEEKKVFKRLVRLCPEEGKRALFLDPNKRELELVAQCGPFESINQVRFSQDGQYVAYSTHDRKISVRHVSLGNEVFRHTVESSKWGWKLLQSPSAKKLLVGVGKLHNNRTTIEIWDISLPSVVFSYETTNSISSYWLMKDHSVIIAENHQGGTYIYRKSLHSNDQPSSFPETLFESDLFHSEYIFEVSPGGLVCVLLKPIRFSQKRTVLLLNPSTKNYKSIELPHDCSEPLVAQETYPWLILKHRQDNHKAIPVSLLGGIHESLAILYDDRYESNSIQVHYRGYTLRAYFTDRTDKKAVIAAGDKMNLMNALLYEYPLQTRGNKIELKVPFMAVGTDRGEIYIFRLPEERRAISQMSRADYEAALANARHPRLPYALQRHWEFIATILEYKLSQEIAIETARSPLSLDTEIILEKESNEVESSKPTETPLVISNFKDLHFEGWS